MLEYSISRHLIEGYLHQPYSWFLIVIIELGKTILSEVSQVVSGGIRPLLKIIAKGTVAAALIILLMITDLKLAIVVGISIGGAYAIIFYLTHSFLNRIEINV